MCLSVCAFGLLLALACACRPELLTNCSTVITAKESVQTKMTKQTLTLVVLCPALTIIQELWTVSYLV